MKAPIKHHSVNWVDGMKLTQQHLRDIDAHFHDSIRDGVSTSLNSFNYGLLPAMQGQDGKSLNLTIHNNANSQIEIILESCNIVTNNGFKIMFSPAIYGENRQPRLAVQASEMDETHSASYYVAINANPYKRVPIGSPDPEEIPLRHPNSYPEITLQLMPFNETNANFLDTYQFIIGVLKWENQRFMWEDSYIPPCTSMTAHPALTIFISNVAKVLGELRDQAVTIIRKNHFGKPINNSLASNTCSICNEILDFCAANIFEIKYILKEEAPIHLVNRISSLANRINTFLLTIEDRQKEELLQYYHEWEKVRPVDFESSLGRLMELEYNHTSISSALDEISEFLRILSILFSKLSQLEYIGQRKDNIVVREEIHQKENVQKTWSLID